MQNPFKYLYFRVLIAIIIGISLGVFYPDLGVAMKPLGDAFIKLIKMIIAPVIFCTVVSGITGMENMRTVGKTFGFAMIYFEIVGTLALFLGIVVVNWVQPGVGMNIDPLTLDMAPISQYTKEAQMESVSSFLLNIIPNTFMGAFADGNIIQVLLISILFGFSLHALSDRARLISDVIEKASYVFFGIVSMVMKIAPIGAFGAMAFTVGKYGLYSLIPLGKLMGTFYLTCLLFIFVVLGLIAYIHGFSIWKFIKYLKEELLIILGTSSSESVLPRMIAKMINLGVSKSVVGLVIPTGYSFNLDGTAIYLTMAAVFIAQATDTPLDISQQIAMLLIMLITSKGAAAVSGGGFIVLAATLSAMGTIPIAGLTIIIGIDRFMAEARSITNLIGNGVATVVIGKWCGEVNHNQLTAHLNNETFIDANEPELELVMPEMLPPAK